MTEPTDAEILDAADDFRSQYMHGGITFDEFDSIGFARAVLDKWGTPPAVAGEPVAIYHGRCVIDCGEHGHLDMEMLKMIPAGSKLYATPQPTQAQAGQLADEQIEDLLECGNPTDEEKRLIRLGWDAAQSVQEWEPVPAKACIKPTHEAADAFWEYWKANGETHKHGYYESTWGAINKALACGWAQPVQAQAGAVPLTADDLKQPRNGKQWRVEWWNESCRMLLPVDKKLDRFQAYRNGTLMFTIKDKPGIKGGQHDI